MKVEIKNIRKDYYELTINGVTEVLERSELRTIIEIIDSEIW
jgi:hypothetical protein